MKTKPIIFIVILVTLISTSKSFASISKNEAISIVTTQIFLNKLDSINIYLAPDSLTGSYFKINPYDSLLNPYLTSWVFFIDIEPWFNWGHRCKYIFVNYSNGNFHILNDIVPPNDFEHQLEHISIGFEEEPINISPGTLSIKKSSEPDPHKFAIIFSGNGDRKFWNDMSHIYCALTENYGITSENIIVLSYDGYAHPEEGYNWSLNLDGDAFDIPDIDGACTKTNLLDNFEWMAENLTDEDLLFVFAATHGFYDNTQTNVSWLALFEGEPLLDYELAPYMDSINCSEIIIIIDACCSGGFVNDLEGDHRVVYTPVPYNLPTAFNSHFNFDEFSYAWGTTLRGYHPMDDNEPWNPSYPIGTKPDIDLIFDVEEDINPDAFAYGGNTDGILQTNEALNYGIYLSANIAQNHEEDAKTGFIEGLLSLYGISGTVTHDQTVSGPFLIGNRLILDYGVDLVVSDNSKFYLNPKATIESPASSSIVFNDNLEFWGFDNNNYMDIHGACTFGENIKFDAGDGIRWVGLNLSNNTKEYHIFDGTFSNCDLSASPYVLEVNNCHFTNSGLNFSHGISLDAYECLFTGACIVASYPFAGTSSINIDYCSFLNTGYSSGSSIVIDDYNSYVISNCTIAYDYHAHGIGIFYAGNYQFNNRLVTDCEIYNPPSKTSLLTEGIFVYNSISDIHNNYIHDNGYGIALLNSSQSTITGEILSTFEEETQRIKNNSYNQVVIAENCYPSKFEWNSMYNDNMTGTYVSYLSDCNDYDLDISDNYWGPPPYDLIDHLYPWECYNYNPIWELQGQLKDLDIAKALYDSAMVLTTLGSFSQAEAIFKDIIISYPSSKYAVAAIKDLFYLKNDFNPDFLGLQNYYDSTAIHTEQQNLAKLSRFFSNQCDVELGNYQNAINWYDSVLLNTGSFEDSIFAIIDRDYVYLRMQNETGKSDPLGIPSFVPKTHKDFIIKRDELLDILKFENSNSPDVYPPDNKENQDFKNCLNQNFPNPFKEQTTFSFTLSEDSDVSLSIYDQLGRIVHSYPVRYYEKGSQSVDFRNDGLSPGVYYFKISVNNKFLDARKLMVL